MLVKQFSCEKILSRKLLSRNLYIYEDDFKLTLAKTQIFTEELLPPAVNMKDTLKEARAKNIGYSNASNDNFAVEVIIKELNCFREFQARVLYRQ